MPQTSRKSFTFSLLVGQRQIEAAGRRAGWMHTNDQIARGGRRTVGYGGRVTTNVRCNGREMRRRGARVRARPRDCHSNHVASSVGLDRSLFLHAGERRTKAQSRRLRCTDGRQRLNRFSSPRFGNLSATAVDSACTWMLPRVNAFGKRHKA